MGYEDVRNYDMGLYENYDTEYIFEDDSYVVDYENSLYAYVVVKCTSKCLYHCPATYTSPAESEYTDWEVEVEKLDFYKEIYDENDLVEVSDELKERIKKEAIERALWEAQ